MGTWSKPEYTHTLDSWVIIFDELVSHKTDGESGLANTSGFVAKNQFSLSHSQGQTRDTEEGD